MQFNKLKLGAKIINKVNSPIIIRYKIICSPLMFIFLKVNGHKTKNNKYQLSTIIPKYNIAHKHKILNSIKLLFNSLFVLFLVFSILKSYNNIVMEPQYEINKTIVKGTIVSIAKTYVLVSFDGNVGICHISNVSDYLVRNLNNFFVLGQTYDFLVINDGGKGQITLSYKAIHPKLLKIHKDVIPTPSGFDNLKEDLNRRIKKL